MAITTNSGVANWSFTLKQGADFNASMTWADSNNVPINLTGWSMKLSISADLYSTPILSINSSDTTGSRIVLGGADGTITLVFSHADTAALVAAGVPVGNSLANPKTYQFGVYDLQYTDNLGNVNYLLEGTVYLDPRVTA